MRDLSVHNRCKEEPHDDPSSGRTPLHGCDVCAFRASRRHDAHRRDAGVGCRCDEPGQVPAVQRSPDDHAVGRHHRDAHRLRPGPGGGQPSGGRVDEFQPGVRRQDRAPRGSRRAAGRSVQQPHAFGRRQRFERLQDERRDRECPRRVGNGRCEDDRDFLGDRREEDLGQHWRRRRHLTFGPRAEVDRDRRLTIRITGYRNG